MAALASFGMRAIVPSLGIGIGAPVRVDALALAKEEAPAERPPSASIRVAPRMSLTPTGGSIGLSGAF